MVMFLAPSGAQGVKMSVCVSVRMTFFKRGLLKELKRELKKELKREFKWSNCKQAGRQASRQALGRHSVGAMPWRGLFLQASFTCVKTVVLYLYLLYSIKLHGQNSAKTVTK